MCLDSGTSLQGEPRDLLTDLLVIGQWGGSTRRDLNDPKVYSANSQVDRGDFH